jgi:hypothetical protein
LPDLRNVDNDYHYRSGLSCAKMRYDVHHVPGGVRFKIADLRHKETLGVELCQALESHDGVKRVEVRPASGSLVVHYSPARTNISDLIRSIMLKHNAVPETRSLASAAARGQAQVDDIVLETVRRIGAVFGQTAFKVALEQVVYSSVRSLHWSAPV